jgi:hypothetical protein
LQALQQFLIFFFSFFFLFKSDLPTLSFLVSPDFLPSNGNCPPGRRSVAQVGPTGLFIATTCPSSLGHSSFTFISLRYLPRVLLAFCVHRLLSLHLSIPSHTQPTMATIFKPIAARQAVRAVNQVTRPSLRAGRPALIINTNIRTLSTTPARFQDDEKKRATTAAPQGASGAHEGAFARTDDSLVIEHPKDEEMPRSPVVQGRGGMHFKRTLASFSLENKVSVVTGGARGLGLVMGQALVASGSDLAIVDLNSMYHAPLFLSLGRIGITTQFGHVLRLFEFELTIMQRMRPKNRLRNLLPSSKRKTLAWKSECTTFHNSIYTALIIGIDCPKSLLTMPTCPTPIQ